MSTLELLEALTKLLTDYKGAITQAPGWKLSLIDLIYKWQTLIAAVVAFLPASLAAVFVWRQVNDQRRQFARREDQQARRARLKLIYSLPSMSRHLDEMYTGLLQGNFSPSLHHFSQETLDDILDAAIVSDVGTFEFSKQYISRCQRYSSLVRLYTDRPSDEILVKLYQQLAAIDIQTDELYPFVRFETDSISLPKIDAIQVKTYLTHHLRRSNSIKGSNLERLFSVGKLPGSTLDI